MLEISKNQADQTSAKSASVEKVAYELFQGATDINIRKEDRAAFAELYLKKLPDFLRDGGISYLFKAERFDGIKMKSISDRASRIADSILQWVERGDLDSIATSKSPELKLNKEELALIDSSIMRALSAKLMKVALQNFNDPAYRQKGGRMEEDLHFISEMRSKTMPSRKAQANSKFGPLAENMILSALHNKKEGGFSTAFKIYSACGVNAFEFLIWNAQ